MHEYRDVTPISWGERFHGPGSHGRTWVSEAAMPADQRSRRRKVKLFFWKRVPRSHLSCSLAAC